ncbi:MAG: hypothetical protein LQ343_000036 [Gyalolechia ehrenbergii]|nr:MAG: hypothetical protein LQ343_000036 [Gyalolechia ehrenbergii]
MGKVKGLKFAGTNEQGSAAKTYDPIVSQLFTSSLGPVKPLPPAATQLSLSDALTERHSRPLSHITREINSGTSEEGVSKEPGELHDFVASPTQPSLTSDPDTAPRRRRKRNRAEDDVEAIYLQRIAKEESKTAVQKEAERSSKCRRLLTDVDRGPGHDGDDSDSSNGESRKRKLDDGSTTQLPQHETLAASKEVLELEKAARTVFLANVATLCIRSKTAKKTLLSHLSSFCSLLPTADTPHKVESLRFRSTPFSTGVGPKKAAYAKRELMDSTAKSTNAYVVYTSQLAAREAVKKLNGARILDRHLLADSVAHPRKTDHRRCVFIGNLGFVDDESQTNAANAEDENRRPRKSREPSDVEEGLWREFSRAGVIESVRVVRDGKTRVGKGFAYVQFKDEIAVEKALLYNDKKFPPLLPRILRVTRAKKMTKTSTRKSQHNSKVRETRSTVSEARYIPKTDASARSLSGRAGKLFGRAGAAQVKGQASLGDKQSPKGPGGVAQGPEQVVFEGYRASSKQGRGAKLGGSGKKQGKPRTRSSRRGAAFKAKGGRKFGTKV